MAGEWIKVERSTLDKAEILAMARALAIDTDAVLGKCVRVWHWFDANSVDGVLSTGVDDDVDSVVRWKGFAAAMRACGWLLTGPDGTGIALPNFDRHNGETAKKRALATRAQAKWRAKTVDGPVDSGLSTNASTREEKRREEKRVERATRLPTDWTPPELLIAWASKERPDLDITTVIAKFRDYWHAKPGRGGTKLDWDATFRNWVREEKAGRPHAQKIKVDL